LPVAPESISKRRRAVCFWFLEPVLSVVL
jgi:hypothetical protein